MKKKVIGVLLATAMAFGLAACGNSAGGEAVKQETEKAEEAKAGTKEEKSGEVTTVTLWSVSYTHLDVYKRQELRIH